MTKGCKVDNSLFHLWRNENSLLSDMPVDWGVNDSSSPDRPLFWVSLGLFCSFRRMMPQKHQSRVLSLIQQEVPGKPALKKNRLYLRFKSLIEGMLQKLKLSTFM